MQKRGGVISAVEHTRLLVTCTRQAVGEISVSPVRNVWLCDSIFISQYALFALDARRTKVSNLEYSPLAFAGECGKRDERKT